MGQQYVVINKGLFHRKVRRRLVPTTVLARKMMKTAFVIKLTKVFIVRRNLFSTGLSMHI